MTTIEKKDIKEVRLSHSSTEDGKVLHLIIMKDGTEMKKRTREMMELGLLKVRGTRGTA